MDGLGERAQAKRQGGALRRTRGSLDGEEVRGRDGEERGDANPLQTFRRGREMGEREKGCRSDLSEGRGYIENQSQTPTGFC